MKKIVTAQEVKSLRQLQDGNQGEFERQIISHSDALLNTAESRHEFRKQIQHVLDEMREAKGIEEKHVAFDKAVHDIADAFTMDVR